MLNKNEITHVSPCANCSTIPAANGNFCSHCGQTSHLHRLSVSHMLHEGIHFFLHADKSIFTLVKALAFTTGHVAKEFINGKRKKYFPPLNFYLIVAGLMVLSMSLFKAFDKEAAASRKQIETIAASIPDPAVKAKIYGIMKRQSNALLFIKKYSNIIGMCAIPVFSLFFFLFYYKGRYNYAEHLVANLYGIGFTSLIFSIFIIPLISFGNSTVYNFSFGAFFLIEITYRSIYYYRLMDGKGTAAAIKAAGIAIAVQIIWIIIVIALMFWYMTSGMSGLLA